MKRFSFSSAIFAGFVATVVMTIFMAFFDMNIMKVLGMAMGKTGTMAYIFGGIIHLAIGLIYGFFYGLIIQPIFHRLPGFLTGLIYGCIIFVIALIFSPMLLKTLHSWGGGDVAMCKARYQMTYNQCSAPQAQQQYDQYGNPVPEQHYDQYGRPMQQQYDQYGNPVQPKQQYDQYGNPVQPKQQYDQYGNPVQPPSHPNQHGKSSGMSHHMCAHPCAAKKSSLPNWLWVLINHLVYGFVLGIFYRPKKTETPGDQQ